MQGLANLNVAITGHTEPEFEGVRRAFLSNFKQGSELGATLAVYHRGKLVVDLAGGLRDQVSGKPYSRETLQPVFSVSKGITALAANMLADRGELDLDAPVASYWPDFQQADKSEIPVRWLLTHQAGILGLDHKVSQDQLLDWNLIVRLLAAQAPDWIPGTRKGYHSLTFGFLVGEVIRRVSGDTVGEYVAREIAGPLEADLFIGMPMEKQARVAPVVLPESPPPTRLPDSGPYAARVMDWISPPVTPLDMNRPDMRAAEIPSANAIGNARSVARMFASMIGTVDGIRCLSLDGMNQARREQWRGMDMVMGINNAVGLGFLLPTEWCPLGGSGSFGAAGFGGSRGWANPELELAFAYVPNLCSFGHFDMREAALSRAAIASASCQVAIV